MGDGLAVYFGFSKMMSGSSWNGKCLSVRWSSNKFRKLAEGDAPRDMEASFVVERAEWEWEHWMPGGEITWQTFEQRGNQSMVRKAAAQFNSSPANPRKLYVVWQRLSGKDCPSSCSISLAGTKNCSPCPFLRAWN